MKTVTFSARTNSVAEILGKKMQAIFTTILISFLISIFLFKPQLNINVSAHIGAKGIKLSVLLIKSYALTSVDVKIPLAKKNYSVFPSPANPLRSSMKGEKLISAPQKCRGSNPGKEGCFYRYAKKCPA